MWVRWTLRSSANKRRFHITSKVKSNIVTGLAAVLLAGVGVAAILVWAGVIERQPTSSAPASSTFEWLDVSSWESAGGGDSPPFRIEAETWRVVWVATHDSIGDGSFTIHVYSPDGLFLLNLYDTADSQSVNFDGPIRGTLGLPGPGEYFLRITTDRDYHLAVQEQR